MGNGTDILFLTLLAVPAAMLAYWGAGLVHLIRALRIPTARSGIAIADRRPPSASVLIIIPAHNEEESIGGLVASLRAQDHAMFRVILCLDRCTDGTAPAARRAIAGDPRFEIIEIRSCPADWAGKVHAICTGLHSAAAGSPDLLLFADADTQFHPSCVRATVSLLGQQGTDLLSLLSTLTTERWFERLVQPAASLELMTQFPLHRSNRDRRRRPFANGQFMLFRRTAYEAIGGHAAVKDELLEDLALARLAADRGLRTSVHIADGLLHCRMYGSWAQFRRGWKRIFTESAKRRPGRLTRAGLRLRVFGAVLPVLTVFAPIVFALATEAQGRRPLALGLASAAALAVWAAVTLASYRAQRAPLWTAVAYPFGAWLTGGILAEAASELNRGVPTRWAGREYARAPR